MIDATTCPTPSPRLFFLGLLLWVAAWVGCDEREPFLFADQKPSDTGAELELGHPDWFYDDLDLLPDQPPDSPTELDSNEQLDTPELPDTSLPEGALRLEVLDVGQGDAILLRTHDGRVALIDGGRSGDRVMTLLRQRGLDRIHLVLASHADADHIGGLRDVLLAYPVELFVDNGLPHTTVTYETLMKTVEARVAEYRTAKAGMRISLGEDVVLEVLWPATQSFSEQNPMSVVLRVQHGSNCFLLTGDADYRVENALLSGALSTCNVLKVSHHGADTATTVPFLRALRPLLGVVSVGSNNYGHPTATVLNNLSAQNVQTLRTDRLGSIEFVSNPDGGLCYRSTLQPAFVCPIGTVEPAQAELLLAEVFADSADPSPDNGYEWVKLYNPGERELDLSDYSLAWGGTSYLYGTLQLQGKLAARSCFLLGGPESNAGNGYPDYHWSNVLTPNLQNGGEVADGVALFRGAAEAITPSSVPIDAIIYGVSNSSQLFDVSGGVGLVQLPGAGPGSSLLRVSATAWELNPEPSPSVCPTF